MTGGPAAGGWRQAELRATTDLAHGGRWTSLTGAGREWLWRHPDVDPRVRDSVSPGDAFIDAGGVEECFPTVRGTPDHGDAWSQPWDGTTSDASVSAGGLRLTRTLGPEGLGLRASYRVEGPPGTPFVHAVHALLDLRPGARLVLTGAGGAVGGLPIDGLPVDGPPVDVLDRPAPGDVIRTTWPDGAGVPLDVLGPDDGTATAAIVRGARRAVVLDGDDALHLSWGAVGDGGSAGDDDEVPCSLLVWRNLGGWPAGAPYRSIGIEPMIGATAEPRTRPSDAARIGPSGRLHWTLTISAWRRTPSRTRHPNPTPPP